LLTAEWCQFLKKHHFMVGISLDGPKEIHDRYRLASPKRRQRVPWMYIAFLGM
jgi:uncharacterized protein